MAKACDRCGTLIKEPPARMKIYRHFFVMRKPSSIFDLFLHGPAQIDLCPVCETMLLAWLENKEPTAILEMLANKEAT